MIFVTGPLYAGKRDYIRSRLKWDEAELCRSAVWDVQELAADCEDVAVLAEKLAAHPVVIATEIGGGVVPVDPAQRRKRENAGRLACLLAQRAETVIRVCCGLPQVLKGDSL